MRETGYYWVKHSSDSGWHAWHWNGNSWYWNEDAYYDSEMFEINETRILNPDEIKG